MQKGRIACWALSLSACSLDGGTLDRPQAEPAGGASVTSAAAVASDAELETFVSRVMKDADQSWASEFQRRNKPYTRAKLVPFSAQAPNPCASIGAVDPKCQDPQAVYIDFDFQRALSARFGGDAGPPQAYAIAHAV